MINKETKVDGGKMPEYIYDEAVDKRTLTEEEILLIDKVFDYHYFIAKKAT